MTETSASTPSDTFRIPPTAGVDHLLATVGATDVLRDVDRADEMMLVFLEGRFDLDRAALEYFRSGANMSATIASLVHAAAPDAAHRVLDFGSGYGRVMRFLAARFGAGRFWASDVYVEGLAFQERRLGVHPLLSHTDPRRFPASPAFRLIFSISVFTHLPEPAFDAWLTTLLGRLEPGGLLAFTVHDEAVLNAGDALPESGLLFLRQSESRSLSTEDYGSTWVNEAFLRRATERAAPGARLLRLPRAICDYHDLILIAPPGSNLPPASAIAIEPAFYLEDCTLANDGRLTLRGWTFTRGGAGTPAAPVAQIAAELVRDGVPVASATSPPLPRPDVPAVFPGAPEQAGFALALDVPRDLAHAGAQVLVAVTLADGHRFTSYAAPLASALQDGAARRLQFAEVTAHREHGRHVAREAHLERELAAVRERLAAVEGTRTWRARRRLRRALGLPELAAKP